MTWDNEGTLKRNKENGERREISGPAAPSFTMKTTCRTGGVRVRVCLSEEEGGDD